MKQQSAASNSALNQNLVIPNGFIAIRNLLFLISKGTADSSPLKRFGMTIVAKKRIWLNAEC
jgi:hypothetical protein